MNARNQAFLASVAADLGLPMRTDGDNGALEQWARIVYSAAGQIAYAALWDQSDGQGVSVYHYKQRFCEALTYFLRLYPEIQPQFAELEKVAETAYSQLLRTGSVYHSPWRIQAAAPAKAQIKHILFERGQSVGKLHKLSGLGHYRMMKDEADNSDKVISMFRLLDHPLAAAWTRLCAEATWRHVPSFGNSISFLNHSGVGRSWWIAQPVQEGTSVLRDQESRRSPATYSLYRVEGREFYASPLPGWMSDDLLYQNQLWRIAVNACLASSGDLPRVRVWNGLDVVRIRLGLLLAPAEQSWLELYSWPTNMQQPEKGWDRCCSKAVFPAIQMVLEREGYQFEVNGNEC